MFVNQVCSVVVTVSGEKPGRDSKELGEGVVPERGKWKDTKGEGYTPFLIAEIVRDTKRFF